MEPLITHKCHLTSLRARRERGKEGGMEQNGSHSLFVTNIGSDIPSLLSYFFRSKVTLGPTHSLREERIIRAWKLGGED